MEKLHTICEEVSASTSAAAARTGAAS